MGCNSKLRTTGLIDWSTHPFILFPWIIYSCLYLLIHPFSTHILSSHHPIQPNNQPINNHPLIVPSCSLKPYKQTNALTHTSLYPVPTYPPTISDTEASYNIHHLHNLYKWDLLHGSALLKSRDRQAQSYRGQSTCEQTEPQDGLVDSMARGPTLLGKRGFWSQHVFSPSVFLSLTTESIESPFWI